ncbi:glycoside hydrolase family 72 protein [Pleomassaria siparia CBS 279.74]|uniref:1,3-beta-glucanosyltransferase n=1 Tax=Pleomassaria siparia CBS 279.74 TaxID=1314801 RepID=A0A6G1K800_9PLEO|nr:glycoside hydrolase family 72 protein [Pleomassaria siparia CBS 279.74]
MPSVTPTPTLLSLGGALALFSAVAHAVHPVVVEGQDFVNSVTKQRLMIVGVDYQIGGESGYKPATKQDPLTNGEVCLRDAAILQRLGVNTIRVYNLDPAANHDDCASIFNAAGIYMVLDVNSPFESIHRLNPAPSYTKAYLSRVFAMVENFKNYPNTLAFFSGNELINDVATAGANPPYIRAVTRDLKQYIAKNAPRSIPVGYSMADVRDVLKDTWNFVQCDLAGETDSSSDFFGLNSYSWCGDASYKSSGYDVLTDLFKTSTIPVFFSEYGCNEVKPRIFTEVAALYSKDMTTMSGGLVYEYSQEANEFGLVDVADDKITLRTDFDNLQAQYNKLDLSLIQATNSSAIALKAPKCDKSLISSSSFNTTFKIPAQPSGVADIIKNGLPNQVVGKLVTVKETAVSMAVYSSDGKTKLTGLTLTILADNATNTPGGKNTSAGTGTSNSTTTTGGQSKSDGNRLTAATAALATVFAIALALL